MKRIYLTAVPLQSNLTLQPSVPEPVNFVMNDSTPYCFPIVRVLAQTMQPEDEAVLIVVRQKNSEKNENYETLLRELNSLELKNLRIKDVTLAESQSRNVILQMFRAVIEATEPHACYYACMTFGTKNWPLVLSSVLNYVEKILDDTQIKGIYYQEALRQNGSIIKTRMYDMSVLFSLNDVVDLVAELESTDKKAAIQALLEGC